MERSRLSRLVPIRRHAQRRLDWARDRLPAGQKARGARNGGDLDTPLSGRRLWDADIAVGFRRLLVGVVSGGPISRDHAGRRLGQVDDAALQYLRTRDLGRRRQLLGMAFLEEANLGQSHVGKRPDCRGRPDHWVRQHADAPGVRRIPLRGGAARSRDNVRRLSTRDAASSPTRVPGSFRRRAESARSLR